MTHRCEIIENQLAGKSSGLLVYRMTVNSQEIARSASPGQFAMIKCGGDTFLLRPFSFCDAFGDSVTFMYVVKGTGTRELTRLARGQAVEIVGPLGNGFSTEQTLKKAELTDKTPSRAAIVGGGAGLFPLLFLARRLYGLGALCDFYLGCRDDKSAILFDKLASLCSGKITMISDDGSVGDKGLVTEPFERAVAADGICYDIVYACGPEAMLKATAHICNRHGITGELSFEQRMGCGIGACLVCARSVRKKTGDGDNITYARVCRDGPVFLASEVIFENDEC